MLKTGIFKTSNKLVVFDLETTDPSQGKPEIIQIGAVKLDKNLVELSSFVTKVRPKNLDNLTPFVSDLTRIKREELEEALPWKDIAPVFTDYCQKRNCKLAAWGTYFDVAILRKEYIDSGIDYPLSGAALCIKSLVYPVFCALGISAKKYGVQKALEVFGIPSSGLAHDALVDARDIANILRYIWENYYSQIKPLKK